MKRLCKNCGSEIEEGINFCENCGRPVEAETAQVTPPQPPAPPPQRREVPLPPPPAATRVSSAPPTRASSTPPPPPPVSRPVSAPPPPRASSTPPPAASQPAPQASHRGCSRTVWIIAGVLLVLGVCAAAAVGLGGWALKNQPGLQIPVLSNLPKPAATAAAGALPTSAVQSESSPTEVSNSYLQPPSTPTVREYSIDFTKTGTGWEEVDNTNSDIGKGHNPNKGCYVLAVYTENAFTYANAPLPFSKPYRNLDVKFRGRDAFGAQTSYGLLFRMKDENNFYYAGISRDKLTLKKVINGKWITLTDPEWKTIEGYNPNQDGYLNVEVYFEGNSIFIMVDKIAQVNISDDSLSEGDVALFVSNYGIPVEGADAGDGFAQAEFQSFSASLP